MTDSPSMQVLLDDQVLFSSTGKWLYPLFDLEDYLQEHPGLLKNATVWDKVIGKAAALLILRMGGSRIHGVLMSELAAKLLEKQVSPTRLTPWCLKLTAKPKSSSKTSLIPMKPTTSSVSGPVAVRTDKGKSNRLIGYAKPTKN